MLDDVKRIWRWFRSSKKMKRKQWWIIAFSTFICDDFTRCHNQSLSLEWNNRELMGDYRNGKQTNSSKWELEYEVDQLHCGMFHDSKYCCAYNVNTITFSNQVCSKCVEGKVKWIELSFTFHQHLISEFYELRFYFAKCCFSSNQMKRSTRKFPICSWFFKQTQRIMTAIFEWCFNCVTTSHRNLLPEFGNTDNFTSRTHKVFFLDSLKYGFETLFGIKSQS